jgi:hypothetical protein
MLGKLITLAAAGAAIVAVAAPVAPGGEAAGLSGTWMGVLEQNLPMLDEPYKTPMSIQAYNGRIVSVNARVRMVCSKESILDAHVFKSFRIGKGPRLTAKGGFALKAAPNWSYSTKEGFVAVSGALGRARGDGNASASAKGCHGNGTWKAARRH